MSFVFFDLFFFFKQKTAYEMRISDWSSDVCSSDLSGGHDFLLGDCETSESVPQSPRSHRGPAAITWAEFVRIRSCSRGAARQGFSEGAKKRPDRLSGTGSGRREGR